MYLGPRYTAVVPSNSDSDCAPVFQYLRAQPLE